MKKVVSLTLILVIMMTLVTSVYAASSYKVALKSNKKELKKGDEFTVSVNLSNIQDEKGIVALGGTLEFDEKSLELVKMEGKGTWANPTYNEENGKLVTERNGYATSNETVFTMVFKVKQESKENLEIVLSNVSASNGDQDIKVDDINTTVSVKEDILPDNDKKDEPFISENTTGENSVNNTTDNKVVSGKDMPDTGSSNVVVILVAIATIATAVSFVRMQKANKEM